MLGSASPELANVQGARWNPPGTAALYTSLAAATARAEGGHLITMQPLPPRAPRTIYEIEVVVHRLVDLSDEKELQNVGSITDEELRADDMSPCQRIGAAVAWLGNDGLLVPSVRDEGQPNLVLFIDNQSSEKVLRVREKRRL